MISSFVEKGSLQTSQTLCSSASVAEGFGILLSAKEVGDGEGRIDCALASGDGVSLGSTKLR